jgi:hypothetical protein
LAFISNLKFIPKIPIRSSHLSDITMGQQPSIPTDLSRPLRVIGAGFPRTGTVSFALALEKLLDGPVSHGGSSILLLGEGPSVHLLPNSSH